MNKAQKDGAKSFFDYQDKNTRKIETRNSIIVTEDGNCFTEMSSANNHAKEQGFGVPLEVTREDVYGKVKAGTSDTGATGGDEVKPFSKMNKKELFAACIERGIEFKDEDTNKVLIEKLETFEAEKLKEVDKGEDENETGGTGATDGGEEE